MSGHLSAKARDVVELASSVSGYPIVVETDPTLDVWSATRYPRRGERCCVIAHHPAHAKYVDYLVAHECGHIYRFFSAKPEEQRVPAMDSEGLKKATKELAAESWELKNWIPRHHMSDFLQSLCFGLVRQVTNTPADCRIEFWIHDNFKELRDVQASALRELYATAAKCLDREVKRWAPPSVCEKSSAMNYVLAKWTGKLLDEPDLIAPYIEESFAEMGEKLDSYLDEDDEGHVGDTRVADRWATEMRINRWYDLAPIFGPVIM